jgi:regulator of protease activity HflC (stomatin/prohibitin superfamily)
MQRIMAREAEAEREKRGIIIKSEGEVTASKNLAQAASILAKYPGSMQLRTLQTINDISSDPSAKFIFYPTDLGKIFK